MSATTNNCPNCGPWPCYHICPNSPHFYSPEQERFDEANYDPSEYYREAGFYDDLDAMADADEQACREQDCEINTQNLASVLPPIADPMSEDIPF